MFHPTRPGQVSHTSLATKSQQYWAWPAWVHVGLYIDQVYYCHCHWWCCLHHLLWLHVDSRSLVWMTLLPACHHLLKQSTHSPRIVLARLALHWACRPEHCFPSWFSINALNLRCYGNGLSVGSSSFNIVDLLLRNS